MALDANRYFSNRNVPGPTLAGGFNKFDTHVSPKYAVGFPVEAADGSVYRYCHFGADTAVGVLVSTDVSETSLVDSDNIILAPASSVNTDDGKIGSYFFEMTLATTTANQYAGGKFITTDDTGEGYTYDIKGNTATDNPASGTIRVELFQPLQVALDATTDCAIAASPYNNVEIATTTDGVIAGVSCSAMDVSEQSYGWIQTKGLVGILADGTIAINGICTLSDSTSGAVQALAGGGTDVADAISDPLVGFCVIAGDSGGHGVYQIDL